MFVCMYAMCVYMCYCIVYVCMNVYMYKYMCVCLMVVLDFGDDMVWATICGFWNDPENPVWSYIVEGMGYTGIPSLGVGLK